MLLNLPEESQDSVKGASGFKESSSTRIDCMNSIQINLVQLSPDSASF